MPLTTDAYFEAEGVYEDVRDEWRKNQNTIEEMKYWQGKKDGIRIVMALLAPDEPARRDWERLNESSSGSRATTREILQAQVNDAYRILEMLQTSNYPEMRRDAKQFVEWVDRTGTHVKA